MSIVAPSACDVNGFDENWLAEYRAHRSQQLLEHGVAVADATLGRPTVYERIGAYKAEQREWNLQENVAEFLELALPTEAFWTSIDMGPARSKAVGGMRKARGLKPGVPDMIIVYRCTTLWIECKAPRGTLSAAQKRVRMALLSNGHHWALARSIDDVIEACGAANIPLTARI